MTSTGGDSGIESSGDRHALEQRWLYLTRELLPGLASQRNWPVRDDHCFQRILLDAVCGGVWYDHVSGRPAYRHLDSERLGAAVALGEQVAAGQVELAPLNSTSLAWRRSRRTALHARSPSS